MTKAIPLVAAVLFLVEGWAVQAVRQMGRGQYGTS
jgi:hypothetical protein